MVASDVSILPGAGRDARPVTFTTPPKDKKLYRRVTLQNGLLAILISDPEMANQTGGGSELESEADMSEEEGGSEDESDEVQISLPPSCLLQGWLTELTMNVGMFGRTCRARKMVVLHQVLQLRRRQQLWQLGLAASKILTSCRYGTACWTLMSKLGLRLPKCLDITWRPCVPYP